MSQGEVFYLCAYPPIDEPEKYVKDILNRGNLIERLNKVLHYANEGFPSLQTEVILEIEYFFRFTNLSKEEVRRFFNFFNECYVNAEKEEVDENEIIDTFCNILSERRNQEFSVITEDGIFRLNDVVTKPTKIQWTDKPRQKPPKKKKMVEILIDPDDEKFYEE